MHVFLTCGTQGSEGLGVSLDDRHVVPESGVGHTVQDVVEEVVGDDGGQVPLE